METIRTLFILSLVSLALAFVLRALIPDHHHRFPWGWPLGSHWVRPSWLVFRIFLIIAIAIGLVAGFKIFVRIVSR